MLDGSPADTRYGRKTRDRGARILSAVLLVLSTSVGLAPNARAQERSTARLDYASPESARCPDEQAFRDIVASRLGYDPFESDAPIAIEASIERRDAELTGRVRAIGDDGAVTGRRDIVATEQDCDEVAASMAIAISILLDPFGVAAQSAASEPEPEPPPPEPEPPPAARPQEPPVRPPAAPPAERGPGVRLAVHALAAVSWGLAPGLAIGPVVGAGVRIDAVSALLEGRADFMPSTAATDAADRLEATVFTAGPTGCVGFDVFQGCVGVQLGAFQGRALDVVDPRTRTSFFASAEVRAGIDVPLGEIASFRALAEMRVPIVRTSLSIDGRTVWNAPPLAGGLSLGVGALFL